MNDPGTAEPISEIAADIEKNMPSGPNQDTEEIMNFLKPSRWWFASTGVPLIAGTFGPIASFFSICALVQPWRSTIPPGGTEAQGVDIKDPHWLIAVNAISLVFALIANGALLLNMARRLALHIAQPIIIVGWFMSGFMLIGLVAAASARSTGFRPNPPEAHALTQAFYYAIGAAGLYCIVAGLMIFTVVGAVKGHYEKEFTLTTAQRTLMLQTIGFLMYLLLGALVFKSIEKWKYLDAVFWADFTLLTIGLGAPLTPKTALGQALLFPYAIAGILSIGLVIGSVRSLVLQRGKEKMAARFLEKQREKTVRSIDTEKNTIKVSWFKKYHFQEKADTMSEPRRREQEFLLMRKIEEQAENHQRWIALLVSTSATLALWLVGAAVFYVTEQFDQKWTYFQALYFSFTSLTTIGYGDYEPVSNSGKPFFVLWTIIAVPTLTVLISHMGDTIIRGFTDAVIWAGTVTILPGESRAHESLQRVFSSIFRGLKVNPKEFAGTNQPPGFLPREDNDGDAPEEEAEKGDPHHVMRNQILDRFAEHIADNEVDKNKSRSSSLDSTDSNNMDPDARDTFNYVYVLTRELVIVMTHLTESPGKKYDYQDWAFFLKLLGQDEADASLHRNPNSKSDLSRAHELGKADDGEETRVWSWMGLRSPLMARVSESQWIADRLSKKLEQELDRIRNGRKRDGPVPVTYADILKKVKQEDGKENGTRKSTSSHAELDKVNNQKEKKHQ
ncbi:voltage-gated potassium channel [Microthyrium microscopicum]|uniref:Voltage-gated potassium channel n=1 Tax=Microthyrium microscopicum TaxID=703497 RepID=A0A6A6UTQ3_9PEZI|nr:voltage-gated potassium channel [Microthyrium microscopicum]